MIIKHLYEVEWTESLQKQFEEIFFESSSRKNFSSQEAKREFLKDWTEYYFTHCPDEVYLALDDTKARLLGYLTGCSTSASASQYFKNTRPSDQLFSELFEDFPAHLHINCHSEFRGQGIGAKLIEAYCSELTQDGACGVHIITSPQAKNVNFYTKNGFDFQCEKAWQGKALLFIGRRLSKSKRTDLRDSEAKHLHA